MIKTESKRTTRRVTGSHKADGSKRVATVNEVESTYEDDKLSVTMRTTVSSASERYADGSVSHCIEEETFEETEEEVDEEDEHATSAGFADAPPMMVLEIMPAPGTPSRDDLKGLFPELEARYGHHAPKYPLACVHADGIGLDVGAIIADLARKGRTMEYVRR